MSESSGVSVRRRRSKVEFERLVLEFERSGLTRQAFCVHHGLSVAALDKYRRRCRTWEHQPAPAQAATNRGPQRQVLVAGVENRILPVELVNSAAPSRACAVDSCRALWVELANGRRIEVAHGFDASTLERLVIVLEKV
jgi:hypothetical protein